MTARWIFHDPVAVETYTVPINPNAMTSPFPKTAKQTLPASPVDGRVRALSTPQPVEWQFSGVIRTQAHYDALLAWVRKQNPVEITDHLGRTFTVLLTTFDPQDQRTPLTTKWTYTVKGYVLGT